MTSDSFVHLHVHGEHSILDGAAGLKALATEAARLGMPAMALTDHGNNLGAYDFFKACNDAGIKPIIGLETYLAPGQTSRKTREKVQWNRGGEDDISGGGAYTHMTLLSTSVESMKNLFALNSRSWLDGVYYKARADRELLNEYPKRSSTPTVVISATTRRAPLHAPPASTFPDSSRKSAAAT